MNVAFVRLLKNDDIKSYRTLGLFFFRDIDELIVCIDEREDPSDCEYLLLEEFRGGIYLEGDFSSVMDEKWLNYVNDKDERIDDDNYFPLFDFKYDGRSEDVASSIFNALKNNGWKPLVE